MRQGNPFTELDRMGASRAGLGSNKEAAWDRVDMLQQIERFYSYRRYGR